MHGWLVAILNLLGMGGGTVEADPRTVTGTWEVSSHAGTWEVPGHAGTWEVPSVTGTWED